MQQNDPTRTRSVRRFRRTAFGLVGVVVAASGIAAGADAAFAAGGTPAANFSDLTSAFGTSGVTEIDVTHAITDTPTGVLTLAPGNNTILDLQGFEVDVQQIQLTSVVGNAPVGATLTVVDSAGGGLLKVDNSSATGGQAARAAVEVDSDAGSSFSIQGARVKAYASNASSSRAAGIGGGTWSGLSGAAGGITIGDYGGRGAVVEAVGSNGGAAIGDGGGAGGASILIGGHADVTATAPGTPSLPGTAAAIGGGSDPQGAHVAGPSLTVDDYAQVHATSYGAGAAIGGGRYGAGGSVTVQGQSHVDATGDSVIGQAGIGDGALSVAGRSTSVTLGNAGSITAVGGGAGGAAIGGGVSSYGGDSLSIGAGTSVTVSAAPGVTAIGAPSGSVFGTLSNSGTLTLRSGSTLTVPAGASASSDGVLNNAGTLNVAGQLTASGTVTNSGTVAVRSGGTFTNSGTVGNSGAINGAGTVANSGAIVQNTGSTFAPGSVTGNAFNVVYDGQGGTRSASTQLIYADSAAAAGVSLATASPATTGSFSGWNVAADGTGAFLGATDSISAVAGTTAAGVPATVNVFAIYQIAPVLGDRTLAQAVVGTPYSATVAAASGTAPILYSKVSGDIPAGLTFDSASGAITGTPTTAGTFTLTVDASNAYSRQHTPVRHSYTIQVVQTPVTVSVPSTAGGKRYLAGATASLRIGGLQANETYTVKIGGRTAASGKASSNTAFTLKVAIPKTIGDGSQTVSVSGGEHANAATAKILTASVAKSLGLKLSAKKVKHGKKIVITVSKLYAGESARVVVAGKHGKTAVGKATSKGTYVVTLKTGLAKGKYTVTVTGAGTARKASAKLTVS